jgi:hypothetical protein
VRQFLKPVTPNARVGKPARQCERLGKMRLAAMEGGVEACDLRNLRRDLHDGANGREAAPADELRKIVDHALGLYDAAVTRFANGVAR